MKPFPAIEPGTTVTRDHFNNLVKYVNEIVGRMWITPPNPKPVVFGKFIKLRMLQPVFEVTQDAMTNVQLKITTWMSHYGVPGTVDVVAVPNETELVEARITVPQNAYDLIDCLKGKGASDWT